MAVGSVSGSAQTPVAHFGAMAKNTPKLPPVPGSGADRGAGKGNPTKMERRAAAAAAAAERQKQARRRALRLQIGIGALLVAVVVGVTALVLSLRGSGEDATPPAGLTADGGVVLGAAEAPVEVVVVEDFQCPACLAFEEDAGDLLAEYRAGDQVSVEYRAISFLDRASSTDYSSRAANAAACVLDDAGADAWMTMHEALFADQPPEGGEGLPDSELESKAATAGADVGSCIEDGTFRDWVEQTTDTVFEDDRVNGTPTVFVNDEEVEDPTAAKIEAAVEAATP
jgi:protein-disulfide isomerase